MSNSVSSMRRNRGPLSMVPWFPKELFELDGVFDSLMSRQNESPADMLGVRLDLTENDQAYEVQLDLPGIRPEDVDIQVENNLLTIRGQRREELEEGGKDKQYHRVERRFGSFSRSVVLPATVSDSEAVAEFKDGVLKITLPKSEQARPRKINIK